MQVSAALKYLNEIKPPVIHYDLKPGKKKPNSYPLDIDACLDKVFLNIRSKIQGDKTKTQPKKLQSRMPKTQYSGAWILTDMRLTK